MCLEFVSEYIAPWALPHEQFPVHLHWKSDIEIKNVIINLPNIFELNEFYNVESYERKNNDYHIYELKTSNYFGFVIYANRLIKELHEVYEIPVIFNLKNNEKLVRTYIANIFRPLLTVVEGPELVISEKRNETEIKLKLMLSGFGKIIIKTDFEVGGKFRENSDELYEELLRRTLKIFDEDDYKDESEKGIKLDEHYIIKKTEEYLEMIQNGIFPEDITLEELDRYKKWMTDDTKQDKIKKLIAKQLENILIDSILYYLGKYPVEGVQMPYGSPKLTVESVTQAMRTRFRYQDAVLNDYEPLLMEIELSNLKKIDRPVEIPIHIEWEFNEINPDVVCKVK